MRKGISNRIILDASVALKWRLDDEEHVQKAQKILEDFSEGKINLVVPELFFIEVANGLKVAVKRGRIGEDRAREFVELLLKLELCTIETADILLNALDIAFRYDRAVYDCIYLAAAEKLGCEIYTGDKKLYNALKGKVDYLKWIGNYRRVNAEATLEELRNDMT